MAQVVTQHSRVENIHAHLMQALCLDEPLHWVCPVAGWGKNPRVNHEVNTSTHLQLHSWHLCPALFELDDVLPHQKLCVTDGAHSHDAVHTSKVDGLHLSISTSIRVSARM